MVLKGLCPARGLSILHLHLNRDFPKIAEVVEHFISVIKLQYSVSSRRSRLCHSERSSINSQRIYVNRRSINSTEKVGKTRDILLGEAFRRRDGEGTAKEWHQLANTMRSSAHAKEWCSLWWSPDVPTTLSLSSKTVGTKTNNALS